MFCQKCGKEIQTGTNFCSNCGDKVKILKETESAEQSGINHGKKQLLFANYKKGIVAYYLQVFLAPIMLVIRMLSQETQYFNDGWRATDYLVVPGNIKAIMYILTVGVVIFTLSCSSKKEIENKKKIQTAKILSIINIFICLCIIEVKG